MTEPRFVKVATYGEVYQADLAKSALEEEGIAVQLHDRETVSMDWLISNTVGGIKVRVAEGDAERARAILAAKMSNPASDLAESLSDDELTRQALAAEPEAGFVEATPATEPDADRDPDEQEVSSSGGREEYAKRFLRASVFSIALFPLWFYAIYLGLNAVFAPGRLSSEGQQRILYGIIACCGNIVLWMLLFNLLLPPPY